jgi:hypothetical protein
VAQLEHMVTGPTLRHPFGSGYSRTSILAALGAERLGPSRSSPTVTSAEEHLSAARET